MLIASSPLKTQHRKRIEALTVEYEFKCPGCNANYIGKTDRCLYTRIKEHSSHDSSEIYNHVISCDEFNFLKNLLELTPYEEDIKCSLTVLIFINTKIIDKSKHWSLILFQESIAINRVKSSLNHGTKASI